MTTAGDRLTTRPLLDRLVGLETEYAVRFHPDDGDATRPVDYELYHALIRSLRDSVLVVPSGDLKEGAFLPTGGAVWFEQVRFVGGHGLVEGSTPECRGPRQAIQFQRGQDRLLMEAARDANVPGVLTLIKNDRDSRGNVYGAQENYELNLAAGWRLKLWGVLLFLLYPLLLIARVGYLLLLAFLFVMPFVGAAVYAVLRLFLPKKWRRPVLRFLVGDAFAGEEGYAAPVSWWLEALVLGLVRVVTAPFGFGLYCLVRWLAFRRVRRELLPFLVTRQVFTGAGRVTPKGEFHLSDKAEGINCRLGFNGMIWDRPVYSVGHFFKSLMFRGWFSFKEFHRLREPRQRLQVCLGDSNMCEEAEYLRVGATMLVLDAIESGAIPKPPRIWFAIRKLHRICRDSTLRMKMNVGGGRKLTAVEIQRVYHDACRDFVETHPAASEASRDVLRRWGEVLDALQSDQEWLVGRVDWVTKRYLLRETAADLAIEAKRKVDLKYHELSPDGYFFQLLSTGMCQTIVNDDEMEHATRNAPEGTRAALRSRYLREFSDEDTALRVNWDTVTIGRGRSARVIELREPTPPEYREN